MSLGTVAVFTWGLFRAPHLAALLGADRVVLCPPAPWGIDAVVGWGVGPNTAWPRRFAARHRLPFHSLEDGFFRSVGRGRDGASALSIVVDGDGIHYDPSRPSRLEGILEDDDLSCELERARRCIARIRDARLSRHNEGVDRPMGGASTRVLVVRQSDDHLWVTRGAVAATTLEILSAARAENPGARLLVLDDAPGQLGPTPDFVERLPADTNPASVVGDVDRVYVATSTIGFEALLAGARVTTFGVPFYAGWGLTDDRAEVPARRTRRRSVEELFAGACLRYARYVDPETASPCDAETVLEHLALQRDAGPVHLPRKQRVVCVGFTAWKRGFLPSFLRAPGRTVQFAADAAEARGALEPDGSAIVVWGARPEPSVEALATREGADVWHMEDGFLRSVGLGSDLNAPASLAVDPVGIYYDPSRPSALEQLLGTAEFDDEERARARSLRARIVEARISKYNVGVARRVGPARDDPREVVLAVGQVEDDASIQLGCVDVRRNEDLLRAARIARPLAYLIYKPHPDVVSGNRQDDLPLHVAERLCDEVVIDASLADCLELSDEVHTMTSLVGFEALLRGIRVVAYGQPFYSGWGLTEDRHPLPRRTRRLDLDELVAGTLLRYPTYVHPVSRAYTTPERIVDYLARSRRPQALQRSWAVRQVSRGRNYLREMWRAS